MPFLSQKRNNHRLLQRLTEHLLLFHERVVRGGERWGSQMTDQSDTQLHRTILTHLCNPVRLLYLYFSLCICLICFCLTTIPRCACVRDYYSPFPFNSSELLLGSHRPRPQIDKVYSLLWRHSDPSVCCAASPSACPPTHRAQLVLTPDQKSQNYY